MKVVDGVIKMDGILKTLCNWTLHPLCILCVLAVKKLNRKGRKEKTSVFYPFTASSRFIPSSLPFLQPS